MKLLWCSETIPKYFNCSNDDNEVDSRSPKKGPEPENVTVGMVDGKAYAFVAVERIGGIMVYELKAIGKTSDEDKKEPDTEQKPDSDTTNKPNEKPLS